MAKHSDELHLTTRRCVEAAKYAPELRSLGKGYSDSRSISGPSDASPIKTEVDPIGSCERFTWRWMYGWERVVVSTSGNGHWSDRLRSGWLVGGCRRDRWNVRDYYRRWARLDFEGFETQDVWGRRKRRHWRDADRFAVRWVGHWPCTVYDDVNPASGWWDSLNRGYAGGKSMLPDTYGLGAKNLTYLMTAWRQRALAHGVDSN
jgi:hypothetical protein